MPPEHAEGRAAASSVAPVLVQYEGSLRPCITTSSAPRRRAPFRQTLLGAACFGALVLAPLFLGGQVGLSAENAELTPRQKAALLVVSGLPAPPGVGGVLVQRWTREAARPRGALAFADQEGGAVRAFPGLPPWLDAADVATAQEAFGGGASAGRALRRRGVAVDLAPVLDSSDGPLGAREFADPALGIAFARGLAAGGVAACAKHFPGLGSTLHSTDEGPARGAVRASELAGFRDAVAAGVACVMVGHAIYRRLGAGPASLEPSAYRLLRDQGFDGVAITDALNVLGVNRAARSAVRAVEAGADMVLFTGPDEARRAIDALVPLAERGELDEHVARVLHLRRALGLPPSP
jgi:beta-glucosidase-like glycosyl hydrolase